MTKKEKILILSPHLDDGVFSCCDHVLKWKQQGHQVTIFTIFTRFTRNNISTAGKQNIKLSGFLDVKKYERQRQQEDIKAMKLLDISWKHLGFVDGGFRSVNHISTYPNNHLFKGIISPLDADLIKRIEKVLSKYFQSYFRIVVPLGIGNHADHIITRRIAEKLIDSKKQKLLYYVDYPYAQQWQNLMNINFIKLICFKKSIIRMTFIKRKFVRQYLSQVSLWSKNGGLPNFEIILLKSSGEKYYASN